MLPERTAAVDRAVNVARAYAAHQQAGHVGTLHLLAGLLAEVDGRAAQLMAGAGLDLARFAEQWPPLSATEVGEVSLAASAEDAFRQARRLAAELSADATVSSELLLVALFRVEPTWFDTFAPLGLDRPQLERAFAAFQVPPVVLEEPLQLAEPTERIDVHRILDANANRAREGLRVVEDYCRFVLDDAFLSGELKRLRHELTTALAGLSVDHLLEARETQADVGTRNTTATEGERHSLRAVAMANLKRLQESLRVLEEVAKIDRIDRSQALEQLRYRSYTLERAIVLGATARERLADARLYVLLTGSACAAALDWTIHEAAAGGATVFQLREKTLIDRALLERARQVRRWTREVEALFIMNDRPDIARLAEADGVHIGQDELSVKEARRIVGADALIGVSTHTIEQVRQAILDGASYIGVGPTFMSGTKSFRQLAGLDFVRAVMAETSLPAFVIGGINVQTIGKAVVAGARRVAVSQAICAAEEPQLVARQLVDALGQV
jgi:thiamine-phosphate pyrophosphorylase